MIDTTQRRPLVAYERHRRVAYSATAMRHVTPSGGTVIGCRGRIRPAREMTMHAHRTDFARQNVRATATAAPLGILRRRPVIIFNRCLRRIFRAQLRGRPYNAARSIRMVANECHPAG